VQGVFFRRFAAGWAASLHITGFARNMGDGRTVEVIAQGSEHDILEYVMQLKKGPSGAQVEDIRLENLTDFPEYNQFSVL